MTNITKSRRKPNTLWYIVEKKTREPYILRGWMTKQAAMTELEDLLSVYAPNHPWRKKLIVMQIDPRQYSRIPREKSYGPSIVQELLNAARPLTAAELAERLGATKQTIEQNISVLVNTRLVSQNTNESPVSYFTKRSDHETVLA